MKTRIRISFLVVCFILILAIALVLTGCLMEPKLYMVTFDTDGGSAVNAQSVQENGKATRPDDPTKAGYTFDNWYAEDTFDTVWNFDTTITEDTTLYAKWVGSLTVGDLGPSGGYIFYDKGSYSDGWQYMEAAPSNVMLDGSDYFHIFGYYRVEGVTTEVGTATDVGTGKTNTEVLVAAMKDAAYTSNITETTTTTREYAARLCDIHEAGGFSDWFLPSKDELDLMYDNLKTQGLGGFSDGLYWSSSEYNANLAWNQHFNGGGQSGSNRYNDHRVRPVRAF